MIAKRGLKLLDIVAVLNAQADEGHRMRLSSGRELVNTRRKLQMLEESYEEARHDPEGGEHVRELELESVRRLINQLKEEIARYEARQPARR